MNVEDENRPTEPEVTVWTTAIAHVKWDPEGLINAVV